MDKRECGKPEELEWREWEKEGSTKTPMALRVMADILSFIQSLKDTTRANVRHKFHKINIILFAFCSCLKENLYLHMWSWEFMLIKESNEYIHGKQLKSFNSQMEKVSWSWKLLGALEYSKQTLTSRACRWGHLSILTFIKLIKLEIGNEALLQQHFLSTLSIKWWVCFITYFFPSHIIHITPFCILVTFIENLVDYNPWGCRVRPDWMTKHACTNTVKTPFRNFIPFS